MASEKLYREFCNSLCHLSPLMPKLLQDWPWTRHISFSCFAVINLNIASVAMVAFIQTWDIYSSYSAVIILVAALATPCSSSSFLRRVTGTGCQGKSRITFCCLRRPSMPSTWEERGNGWEFSRNLSFSNFKLPGDWDRSESKQWFANLFIVRKDELRELTSNLSSRDTMWT